MTERGPRLKMGDEDGLASRLRKEASFALVALAMLTAPAITFLLALAALSGSLPEPEDCTLTMHPLWGLEHSLLLGGMEVLALLLGAVGAIFLVPARLRQAGLLIISIAGGLGLATIAELPPVPSCL